MVAAREPLLGVTPVISKWARPRMILPALLGSFVFGYQLSALNATMPRVVHAFGWCQHAPTCPEAQWNLSLVSAALFIGAALGSISAGALSLHGRRKVVLFADALVVAGSLITTLSTGIISLILGRLINGLSIGILAVTIPMYISEISSKEGRGTWGVLHQLCITTGIFVAIALGMPDDISWWRCVLFVPVPVAAFQAAIFGFVFTQETPAYLMFRNHHEEARKVLMTFLPDDEVRREMQMLQLNISMRQNEKRLHIFEAMFTPYHRFAVFLGISVAFLQQLAGMNVVNVRSTSLFRGLELPPVYAGLAAICIAFLSMIMTVVAIPFVDSLGRRPLTLIGYGAQTISMMSAWLSTAIGAPPMAVVVSVMCFVASYACSTGPLLWIYLSEIYPVELRPQAMSFAVMLNWSSAGLIVAGSEFLSTTALFLVLTTTNFAGLVFSALFFVETAGSSAEASPVYPSQRKIEMRTDSFSVDGDQRSIVSSMFDPSVPLLARKAQSEFRRVRLGDFFRARSSEDLYAGPLNSLLSPRSLASAGPRASFPLAGQTKVPRPEDGRTSEEKRGGSHGRAPGIHSLARSDMRHVSSALSFQEWQAQVKTVIGGEYSSIAPLTAPLVSPAVNLEELFLGDACEDGDSDDC